MKTGILGPLQVDVTSLCGAMTMTIGGHGYSYLWKGGDLLNIRRGR
jgi:hypothetical protein